jgi:hypothetical protein
MIERIRTALPWHAVDDSDDKLPDREILNIFRSTRNSEETMLKTQEVAASLSITPEWTHKRLERLEEEGRVESRDFGGVDVWRLSPTETSTPVPGSAVDLGWWSFHAYEAAFTSYQFGAALLMIGGLFLIPIFILSASAEINTLLFSQDTYAASAMAAALLASFVFIGGGICHLSALGLRRHSAKSGGE